MESTTGQTLTMAASELAVSPTEKTHRNEAKSPEAQEKCLHRG
jgi:hypothetical protein